jgi:biopolymer transport protein ExbD
MAASTNTQSGTLADINMTPLIDVMLVLLVIFIITLPRQTRAVKIDNPIAAVQHPLPRPVVDVGIDFDGTLAWNGGTVDREQLRALISQASAQSLQPEVHLSVDKFAKYEIVAQTLADLQSRGLKSIGFNNQPL